MHRKAKGIVNRSVLAASKKHSARAPCARSVELVQEVAALAVRDRDEAQFQVNTRADTWPPARSRARPGSRGCSRPPAEGERCRS